jgi:type IV pilus assembly PilN-like protein
MIEINLLPKELRKVQKITSQIPDLPLIPIIAGVIGIFIMFNFLVSGVGYKNGILEKRYNKKWDAMHSERMQTGQISRETKNLQRKLNAINKIDKPLVSWTQIMNGLNQAMTTRVWLSNLEVGYEIKSIRRGVSTSIPVSLEINGYALGTSGQATSQVAKFITSLKGKNDFSQFFDAIELEKLSKNEVAGQEVMTFNLSCKFKKAGLNKVEKDKKGKK